MTESEEFFYDKDRFPPPGAIDWVRVAGESIYQAARPLNVGIGLTLYRMASLPVLKHPEPLNIGIGLTAEKRAI